MTKSNPFTGYLKNFQHIILATEYRYIGLSYQSAFIDNIHHCMVSKFLPLFSYIHLIPKRLTFNDKTKLHLKNI